MKNHLLFWLLIILVGLVIIGIGSQNASASIREQDQGIRQSASGQVTAQTPIPTDSPSYPETATTEIRELPQVGQNAGLVIAASVLVLIIIGGVLGVQRKQKH